jgi:hypothetical protein
MSKKIGRDPNHELNHHRKAGAHTPKGRPDPRSFDMIEWLEEIEAAWDEDERDEEEEHGSTEREG